MNDVMLTCSESRRTDFHCYDHLPVCFSKEPRPAWGYKTCRRMCYFAIFCSGNGEMRKHRALFSVALFQTRSTYSIPLVTQCVSTECLTPYKFASCSQGLCKPLISLKPLPKIPEPETVDRLFYSISIHNTRLLPVEIWIFHLSPRNWN